MQKTHSDCFWSSPVSALSRQILCETGKALIFGTVTRKTFQFPLLAFQRPKRNEEEKKRENFLSFQKVGNSWLLAPESQLAFAVNLHSVLFEAKQLETIFCFGPCPTIPSFSLEFSIFCMYPLSDRTFCSEDLTSFMCITFLKSENPGLPTKKGKASKIFFAALMTFTF